MKPLFVFLMGLNSWIVFSQAPDIAWQKLIGGSNNEIGSFVFISQDNNIFIGSRSDSNTSGDKTQNARGGVDYWLVKTTSTGTVLWDITMGAGPLQFGTDNNDIMDSVYETTDGKILAGGSSNASISGEKTEVSRGDYDYWILKLDDSGAILWDKTIGGNSFDALVDFFETNDGNYMAAGGTFSSISGEKTDPSRGGYDIWILKLDTIGNIIWQKTIGGSYGDTPDKIIQTADGGFMIAGTSSSNISGEKTENSYGLRDYWVIKLDSNGTIQWQKTIGGSGDDFCETIIETNDGGYLVGGHTDSNISGVKTENSRGGKDFWVIKLDVTGTIQWQKTLGGSSDDSLFAITQCLDSGYILTGSTLSGISGDKTEAIKGDYDAWVVKLNETGTLQWQKDIGGVNIDGLNYVQQLADASFILGGGSRSSNSFDVTETNHGQSDLWVVKLYPENLSVTNFEVLQNAIVYPNPTKAIITIDFESLVDNCTITVSNLLGQKISKDDFFNLSTLQIPIVGQSGVYFVTIQTKLGARIVFKVIKD